MSILHAAGENECGLICGLEGGDERTRTADPLLANPIRTLRLPAHMNEAAGEPP